MCLAESAYYPECGCWFGHEVVSPCIRRHGGGAGGECRELVVQGVLRKPGSCIPCQRKRRLQSCDVGRNLSDLMNEINEFIRSHGTEDHIMGHDPCSEGTSAVGSVGTPELGLQEDWALDVISILQSPGDDKTIAGDGEDGDVHPRVQDKVSSASAGKLGRYLELYSRAKPHCWYYVAAGPPSPSVSEAWEHDSEGDFLLGGPAAVEGEELFGQATSDSAATAAAPKIRPNIRTCACCVPS